MSASSPEQAASSGNAADLRSVSVRLVSCPVSRKFGGFS